MIIGLLLVIILQFGLLIWLYGKLIRCKRELDLAMHNLIEMHNAIKKRLGIDRKERDYYQ